MKKRIIGFILILSLAVLAACGSSAGGKKAQKIIVGSSGSDAQVWKFIAKSKAAKKAGLKIVVKEFSDGTQINDATNDGLIDVNAFQSLSYFQDYNKRKGDPLAAIATTYLEPMGIYSKKVKSLKEIPGGAKVAIPNDAANTARALRVLRSAGLIKLKPDFNSFTGLNGITSNPKKLKFVEMDGRMTARALPDVTISLIGNSVALDAGLNSIKDSIYHEKLNQDTIANINLLVTKKSRSHEKALLKLKDLYHSKEVQDYVKKEFGGTKVPVEKPVSEIINNK